MSFFQEFEKAKKMLKKYLFKKQIFGHKEWFLSLKSLIQSCSAWKIVYCEWVFLCKLLFKVFPKLALKVDQILDEFCTKCAHSTITQATSSERAQKVVLETASNCGTTTFSTKYPFELCVTTMYHSDYENNVPEHYMIVDLGQIHFTR